MRMPRPMMGLILAGLAAAGCHARYVLGRNTDAPDATSDIGGDRVGGGVGGGSGSPDAGSDTDGATDGGWLTKPPALDGAPTPESAGQMTLRRLTLAELTNTLVDLLGASRAVVKAALASAGFPDEETPTTGFLAPGSFSPAQTQSLLSTAEQLAGVPSGSLPSSCSAPAAGAGATACAASFITSFGLRAFRRPVTDQEAGALLGLFTTAAGLGFDFQGSLTQVVRGMMQSPNFLYHWEVGDATPSRLGSLIALTPYQIASRLSYLLWQTMPDDTLLAAAGNGQLTMPAQILSQADRMLDDSRAQTGLANFHRQWLRVDGVDSLQKDPRFIPASTRPKRKRSEPSWRRS